MTRPQIVINVHGGVVQEVFASVRDLQVVLVDWEQEELDSSRPELRRSSTERHRDDALLLCGECGRASDVKVAGDEQNLSPLRDRFQGGGPAQGAIRLHVIANDLDWTSAEDAA